MEEKQISSCDICYKIICRQCQWEADEDAVVRIQCGKMTACPECGWKPGQPVPI